MPISTGASNSQDGDAPEVFTSDDPFALFDEWMALAVDGEKDLPDACALATADADGIPNVRMVLLKAADPRGFVFYTNLESVKGEELHANPNAALCFHWKSIKRQIRIKGMVVPITDEEADAYFETRDKGSQIGAWASHQSRTLEGRFELERNVAKYAAKYTFKPVPRPSHWSGFRIQPVSIEFWRNRTSRLHDRLVFNRDDVENDNWTTERLYP